MAVAAGIVATALAAALFCSSGLLAQEQRQAEIEYSRGELLLEMRDYPRAIFAFNKAWSMVPDERYLSGLARAWYAKGDLEKALVAAESHVERAGGFPDSRVVAIATAVKKEFEGQRERVQVRLFPGGGKLTCTGPDGVAVVEVISGGESVRWLPMGENVVEYERDSFSRQQQRVVISRGQPLSLSFELQPAAGEALLMVEANVPRAAVYLDGQEAGAVPFEETVAAGDHLVQVWARNHLAWNGVVAAVPGRSVMVTATLAPSADEIDALPIPQLQVDDSGPFFTLSTWGWITMAAGVGALGGGGYLYWVWSGKWNEVLAEEDDDEQARLAADANVYYMSALASGIAGGALVAGGLLMVLFDDSGKKKGGGTLFERLAVAPGFLPGGAALDALITF